MMGAATESNPQIWNQSLHPTQKDELTAAIANNDPSRIVSLLNVKVSAEPTAAPEQEENVSLELYPKASQSSTISNDALHLAAVAGTSVNCLDVIFQHSADINSTNAQGRTALHLSCFHGNSEVVNYLLENKAIEVDKVTPAGCTAAYFAAYRGHREILKSLLAAGSSPDAKTKAGSTPLIVSALNGHRDIVGLLLNHKADPNIKNKAGATAMHTAAFKGYTDIVEIIKRHGGIDSKDEQGRTAAEVLSSRKFRQSPPPSMGLVMPNATNGWGLNPRTSRASVTLTSVEDAANKIDDPEDNNTTVEYVEEQFSQPPPPSVDDTKTFPAQTKNICSSDEIIDSNKEKPNCIPVIGTMGDSRASPTGSTLSG